MCFQDDSCSSHFGTWQAVPEWGGAKCQLEGGKGLTIRQQLLGSGPILGALRMLRPGILRSTL